jgi:hypothetical protein
MRAEAEGIVRTCRSAVMARAAVEVVDVPLAAVVAEVGLAEVGADAAVAAEAAFTLLFTKRCSLASKVMVEPLGCPENRAVLLESRVRTLRAGAAVGLACETKVSAGTSFTTFHLSAAPGETA